MAYANYLIKINNVEIPLKYISLESYSVTYQTIDLDSYRDANGTLHRTALSHKVGKVEFETPIMRHSDVVSFMTLIRSKMADSTEKKVSVTFYNPETDTYISQNMYIPDITFKIMQNSPQGFIYSPTRIAFIGY